MLVRPCRARVAKLDVHFAVRCAGFVVAFGVVVLNALPRVVFIDVADGLFMAHPSSELDRLVAMHTTDPTAHLDKALDCSTFPGRSSGLRGSLSSSSCGHALPSAVGRLL